MRFSSAPSADQPNIQFVAGSIRAEKFNPREDQSGRADGSGVFEKIASFHKIVFKLSEDSALRVCNEFASKGAPFLESQQFILEAKPHSRPQQNLAFPFVAWTNQRTP